MTESSPRPEAAPIIHSAVPILGFSENLIFWTGCLAAVVAVGIVLMALLR